MARTVFLLLVLANLLFFVWSAGYLGGRDEGHEPGRLKDQLNAERLRIVTEEEAAAAPVPETRQPIEVCRRIGPLSHTEAESLKASVTGGGGAAALSAAEEKSYWVLIPPLASKQAADQKAAELKALGVTEFFIVTEDSPYRHAISLGLFRTEEGAKEQLQQLSKKGVRSAKIGTRSRTGTKAMLDVRGPAELLDKLQAGAPAIGMDCPAKE